MILSADEIARITEYAQPQKQCETLMKLGISFGTTLKGNPIVCVSEVERWASGRKVKQATIRMDKFEA
jgi:hypothetical protein